jgi:glycosyltransferase involved in cell wall biosynthesis
MRVLFDSYHGIGRMYGGGPSIVYNLKAELEARGVEVRFYDKWTHNPADWDLFHYFSVYDPVTWLRHLPSDPPFVCTPITWYDMPWKVRIEESAKYCLRALRYRTWDRRFLGYPDAVPDHWFPNSEGEAHFLSKHWRIPRSKMTNVPHGVSARFAEGDAKLFESKFGLRDFVLCVGRFEPPRKNQLTLVRVMKSSDVPLVFIGGSELGHEAYFDQCKAEAGKNTRFLDSIAHDDPLLKSAYHAAKVVVQPALLESPGLTGLEGALGGANIANTTGGSTREYFANHAWYFDPKNEAEMREAVLAAFQAPRGEKLRERVLKNYTWSAIADTQIAAYKKVLAQKGKA